VVKNLFFSQVSVGQQIPSLVKKAEIVGYKLPDIFNISSLEKSGKRTLEKSRKMGVDSIHVKEVFGGPYLLQFLSQMITKWLPNIRGWIEGGELDVKFTSAVTPGEMVTCKGKVVEKKCEDGTKILFCDIWVEKQNGEKVVIGSAKIKF